MNVKEYQVKRKGGDEWESVVEATTFRKAAIVFANACEGLKPNDHVVVEQKGATDSAHIEFLASDLVTLESWAVDYKLKKRGKPMLDEEKLEEQTRKFGVKIDRVRAQSSYQTLRLLVNVLFVISLCLFFWKVYDSVLLWIKLGAKNLLGMLLLPYGVYLVSIITARLFVQMLIDIPDILLMKRAEKEE